MHERWCNESQVRESRQQTVVKHADHAIERIAHDGEDAQRAGVDLPRETPHHVVEGAMSAIDLVAQMLGRGCPFHGVGDRLPAALVDVHEEGSPVQQRHQEEPVGGSGKSTGNKT